MIITTAKNDRLAQGIIRELKDLDGISQLSLKHIEGAHHAEWVLADCACFYARNPFRI